MYYIARGDFVIYRMKKMKHGLSQTTTWSRPTSWPNCLGDQGGSTSRLCVDGASKIPCLPNIDVTEITKRVNLCNYLRKAMSRAFTMYFASQWLTMESGSGSWAESRASRSHHYHYLSFLAVAEWFLYL